ncbi:putative bifunctional diguanylate cyclase/phosphodiesterase [Roseibium sp.]|uniref:putative bifunctional diguanylate cyclase/phosphodiesterase n=1 Tax=Roseibium sp. TaxID=1936156 RepID=UPI003D111A6A
MQGSKSSLRLVTVAWPFVAIIVTQTLLATFSLQIVSSLRAYVTGESLWSKGQKEAVYNLEQYIVSADPSYLERFRKAIAIPLGDRQARLAMEAGTEDRSLIVEGFRQGENHPDDIPGLILLFENFQWFSYMRASVEDWRNADVYILALEQLGNTIGDAARLPDAERLEALEELNTLERKIVPLSRQFSHSLGEGSRVVQTLLLLANLALAAIFVLLTVWRLNSFLKHRRSIEGQLSWNAYHDDLTGLPNRRLFERELRETLEIKGSPHAVILLDLDQFKSINDTGGHAVGDHLLRCVARDLPGILHKNVLLARLGGDEFGLVLRNCTADEANAIGCRLREAVEKIDFSWEGLRYAVTASIGVVAIGEQAYTFSEALRAADVACYIAKERGRNRVHIHTSRDCEQSHFASSLAWVQRLHRAVEQGNFCLFLQAIAPAGNCNGQVTHYEILLRLEEDGKTTSPVEFIPAAERFGLMPVIDRWVVQNALALIGQQDPEGRNTYAINLSGLTLTDETFLDFLLGELNASGVSPSCLCFELTETSAIANFEEAILFIDTMREKGCRFALDDFGVGMSSLTYLKRLPVDFVKIDGSFVLGMLNDDSDRLTVEMINKIAHLSGKKTIAEFVETPELLEALRTMAVDYVQGYAIGRPEPFVPSEALRRRFASKAVFPDVVTISPEKTPGNNREKVRGGEGWRAAKVFLKTP